jgi:outer membrane lipoprotein-sorting protein
MVMKRLARFCALVAPLAVCAAMATGDTLESVEKTIIEKGKKVNSMSYKSTYFSETQYDQTKTRSEGKTVYESMKKGDMLLYRMETVYSTVTETNGTTQTSKGESTSVCDGKYAWVYTVADGAKSVMKQNAMAHGGSIDRSFFDTLAMTYNLDLQPDAKVGSRSTYVIRAVPKQPSPMMGAEQFYYFDKATGLMLKSVTKDKAGKVTMESNTTDLKVDSTISADRFVFEPPEGVPITDLTQQQPGESQPSTAESQPAAEQPAEEPEKEEPAKTEKKEKKSKWPKLPKKKWP